MDVRMRVSKDLLAHDLTERLHSVGLSFIGKKGEYELVNMADHPDLFPEVLKQVTRETQDVSP